MSRRTWTPDDVRALGVRTTLPIAADVVLGVGRTRAYELYRAGELPFPALRAGHRVVCPVAPLLALLGLDPRNSEAGPASPAIATTDSPLVQEQARWLR